jgi:TRAP transporter T-component
MKRPYNKPVNWGGLPENAEKLVLLFVLIALEVMAISCGKAETATHDAASRRPSSEVVAEADQFYAGRADLSKVRQGIVALRQAQGDDANNYELAWRLSRFNYDLGAHTTDHTERDKAFKDGIEAGKTAVKLQDGKPEGHFWLGANYGGKAQNSMLAGLSELDDIKHEMEAVLKLDESYQSGSAYMVLGQVYLQAPGMLGGDTQKAIDYLEKGLRFGADNALLRAHLATAYADANRKEDARKQVAALMAMKPSPAYQIEYDEAIVEVKKLDEKLK